MGKKIVSWILLVLLVPLSIVGCGEEETEVSLLEKTAFSVSGQVTGELNPFYTDAEGDLAILSLITARFVSSPDVASIGEEITEDGMLKVTVTVSEEVCCSDRTGLYAIDFMYAVQLVCDPTYDGPYTALSESSLVGLSDFRSGNSQTIAGLEKVNAQTCTVLFSDPDEDYQSLLDLPAVRTLNYGEYQYGKAARENITTKYVSVIGTGPFCIDSGVPMEGNMVNLERNKYYHGTKPKSSQCSVRYVRDEDVALNIKLGQLTCGFLQDKELAASEAKKYGYHAVMLADGALLMKEGISTDPKYTVQQALLELAIKM